MNKGMQRRRTKKPKTLKQLKREALKLATGYVRAVKVNPFIKAWVYFRWDSDTFMSAYWLGYAPTEKVPPKVWNYLLDRYLWDEIQDSVREFIDNQVDSHSIDKLCREADEAFYRENPEANKEDYLAFEANFFHALDDETEEVRDRLLDKHEKRIRKAGGEYCFEAW